MAGILLRIGDNPNASVCEFAVDTEDEIQYLPTTQKKGNGIFENNPNFDLFPPMGSTCVVGNDGSDLLIYMLFSFGWKKL